MKKAISLSASILFLMAAIMMFLMPFSGLAETDDPDAAAHEAQIMANAKRLYNQVISEHGSAAGYVNYIAQQERYYRVTMNEAEYYNSAYDKSVSFCTTLAKVGVSVISKSPSDALVSVGKTYYNQFLKEISKGLPKISKAEFVYGQATAGIEEIRTADLWDIMDRVAANGGEFVSAEDAVNFIVGYQNNRACFVSAELGRAYYYDQLNQGPWDTLGEIGVNVFISEVSKKICPYETYWEVDYLKGYAVTQMKNYVELIATQLENPHITKWKEDLEAIEAETEKMLSYIPTAGSPYLPTLPAHTVTYDPNGGRVGVSRYIAYEGEAYGYMPTPFWFGYEFLGWFDAPEGGTAYTASSIYSLTSNQTLYAHWGREILSQGSCGPTLTYVLYVDGLLEIDGYGDMNDVPWREYADRISEVHMEEGITYIAIGSFKGSQYLHHIDIPQSVEVIGGHAFEDSGLLELELPLNIHHIDANILSGNTQIRSLVIPKSIVSCSIPLNKSNVETVVFEDGLKAIPRDFCCFCNTLKTVKLPESVLRIGDEAFRDTNLDTLIFPNGLEHIGYDILDGNTTVKSIIIPGTVKTMGCNYISRWPTADEKQGVLWGSSVQRAVIEEGVKRVGDGFACNVSSLEYLELPSTIGEIGQSAFYGTSIHSVVLDHSIERIESDAFGKCPEDLIIFGYKGTAAEEYAMSNGIQFVARDIDVAPSDFILPNNLGTIEEEAFMGCAFRAVMIQDGVRKISPRAFANCRNLVQICIPASVSEIAADSFSGCEDSLLIICEKGSIAEKFATEGGYRYQYP